MSKILVYRYGLLAPTQNAEKVREQMRLAHEYRNTLTEVERARRAAIRQAMSAYDDVRALEEEAAASQSAEDAAARMLKAERASTRSRSETEPQRAALKEARERRRECVAKLRARRATLRGDAGLTAEMDRINGLAAELQRAARAICRVYWGTYLLAEDAAQASRKMPLYDGAEPNDPRFIRWTGDGQVGVQLQGGLATEEAFGSDTQIRIRRVAERSTRSAPIPRNRQRFAEFWMRVGSNGRDPVWAVWPMVLHRPLPEGAQIKRATVSLRKRGPREEWSVEMTVALDEAKPRVGHGTGAVAIDIGWRLVPGGIRVAYWLGEDGASGECILNEEDIDRLRKPDDLRAIRDKNFNAARAQLAGWLAIHECPLWLREATATLDQWRSVGRLAALVRRWASERFGGDVEIYPAMEAWRYHDHHLWVWEVNQRMNGLRRRRERYRVFAAGLVRRYGTLVIEDFDLREIARHAPPDAAADNDMARSNRQLAAVSELRLCLVQAFEGRGGEVKEESAVDTTMRCHLCGHTEAFDAAASLWHMCGKCGEMWDQDRNAAANLLAAHRRREQSGGVQEPGSARGDDNINKNEGVGETRWARARRLRAEKEARNGTARKADDKISE